ncbi:predicted protein [Botrytis cinerea T4]|uniref:Uncharacterized protein n=1 Tax=Botryotinia fuckeliana (strain T4) TaxID=999810 RepID=G2Y706_BOTF4|nr:predicted protein [Botrytis cinerea T4]
MHVHQLPQQASTSKFPAGPQLEKLQAELQTGITSKAQLPDLSLEMLEFCTRR